MRCVYLHKRGLNAVVHNYLLRLDVVSHMTLVVYPSHVVADTWEEGGGGEGEEEGEGRREGGWKEEKIIQQLQVM